jgi:hypothetical protein
MAWWGSQCFITNLSSPDDTNCCMWALTVLTYIFQQLSQCCAEEHCEQVLDTANSGDDDVDEVTAHGLDVTQPGSSCQAVKPPRAALSKGACNKDDGTGGPAPKR